MVMGGILFLLSYFNINLIFFINFPSHQFLNLRFFFDYIRFQFLGVLLIIVGRVVIFSLLYMVDEVIRYNSFI